MKKLLYVVVLLLAATLGSTQVLSQVGGRSMRQCSQDVFDGFVQAMHTGRAGGLYDLLSSNKAGDLTRLLERQAYLKAMSNGSKLSIVDAKGANLTNIVVRVRFYVVDPKGVMPYSDPTKGWRMTKTAEAYFESAAITKEAVMWLGEAVGDKLTPFVDVTVIDRTHNYAYDTGIWAIQPGY